MSAPSVRRSCSGSARSSRPNRCSTSARFWCSTGSRRTSASRFPAVLQNAESAPPSAAIRAIAVVERPRPSRLQRLAVFFFERPNVGKTDQLVQLAHAPGRDLQALARSLRSQVSIGPYQSCAYYSHADAGINSHIEAYLVQALGADHRGLAAGHHVGQQPAIDLLPHAHEFLLAFGRLDKHPIGAGRRISLAAPYRLVEPAARARIGARNDQHVGTGAAGA